MKESLDEVFDTGSEFDHGDIWGDKGNTLILRKDALKNEEYLSNLKEQDEDFENVCAREVDHHLVRSSPNEPQKKFYVEFTSTKLDKVKYIDTIEQPRELVLYAGVGGSSIGERNAGFDVRWLVEKNQMCAASLQGNYQGGEIFVEDVYQFLDKCEEGIDGYPQRDEVDHIQSSPPCQPWSRANRFGGKNDEQNRAQLLSVLKATENFRQKSAVVEQVTGILGTPKGRHFLKRLIIGFLKIGYQVRVAVHNASLFGDPQSRNRVIMTFVRGDIPLPPMPVGSMERIRSVDDAFQELVDIDPQNEGSGLVALADGSVIFNHIKSTNSWTEPIKLIGSEPANTVLTSGNIIHPTLDRAVSLRELANLFSYPSDKQFFGSKTEIRRQIGNSVPVKLAEAIAKSVITIHRDKGTEDE
jgi:DNA (cytosine-5)-methyltransferase 1